jgi:sarcosine oxidase subunit gamma
VAELIETPPVRGLPITIGEVTLELCPVTQATWIAALPGRLEAVSGALKKVAGIVFPAPDRIEISETARAVWMGPEEALLFGSAPQIAGAVATDYSDGIAVLRVCGGPAREVLMRLTPLDLREAMFPVGASARTLLGHLTVSLVRTDEETFEVIVMRSMTRTAVHELTRAMTGLAG